MVLINSKVGLKTYDDIVIFPIDSLNSGLNINHFSKKFTRFSTGRFLTKKSNERSLKALITICEKICLYLSIMGWVTENDLNPANREILPNIELNIPASTDKRYRARFS